MKQKNDQLLTYKKAKLGPVFNSTAYAYIYMYIYISLSLSLSRSLSLSVLVPVYLFLSPFFVSSLSLSLFSFSLSLFLSRSIWMICSRICMATTSTSGPPLGGNPKINQRSWPSFRQSPPCSSFCVSTRRVILKWVWSPDYAVFNRTAPCDLAGESFILNRHDPCIQKVGYM